MVIKSEVSGTPDELEYALRMLMEMLSKQQRYQVHD